MIYVIMINNYDLINYVNALPFQSIANGVLGQLEAVLSLVVEGSGQSNERSLSLSQTGGNAVGKRRLQNLAIQLAAMVCHFVLLFGLSDDKQIKG